MKTITGILIALVTLVAARAADQRRFATEVTVTLEETTGHHVIVAKVSELITDEDAEETDRIKAKVPVLGDIWMKLIAAPRMTVVPGKRASITSKQSDDTSVRADVFWPESRSDSAATLVITLRSKTEVLTLTSFKLNLEKE